MESGTYPVVETRHPDLSARLVRVPNTLYHSSKEDAVAIVDEVINGDSVYLGGKSTFIYVIWIQGKKDTFYRNIYHYSNWVAE